MSKTAKTTAFLKECMADALLKQMESTPFEKITVLQITQTAGVGRTTWFRNFSSKSEALTYKLICLWERWAEEHQLSEYQRFALRNAESFFEFNYDIRRVMATIYDAGLQSTVYNAFYQIMVVPFVTDAEERYSSCFYSYGVFGIMDEWIHRGYRESPREMAELLRKVIQAY